MLRYVVIALVAASAAQANVLPKKQAEDVSKREQRMQELAAPPKSVSNICRGC